MTPAQLHNDIRNYCRANANPAVVKKYSRYFKSGYNAYGLTQEVFEKHLETLLKKKHVTLRLVLTAAPLMLKSKKYEETSYAIRLLEEFSPQFTKGTFGEVEKWFKVGISNWAHSDTMSLDIVSYFLMNRIVPLAALQSWSAAANIYQRRAVPVSMIKELSTSVRPRQFFVLIEPLMMDGAREVQQGVGWFLRESWKLRKAETERFLSKWKNKSPRLIYQYATEKMSPTEKQRFRKAKKENRERPQSRDTG